MYKEPVDVLPGKKYPYHSTANPWVTEHNCRCRVPNINGQDRLEAESDHLPQDRSTLGPTGSGPLCFLAVNPVPMLLQLVARFICISNRCIPPDMNTHEGVCQSTLEPSGQDSISDSDRTGKCCAGSSSIKVTTMVPNPVIDADRLPSVNNIRPSNDAQSGYINDVPTLAAWRISGRDTEVNIFRGSYRLHAQIMENQNQQII